MAGLIALLGSLITVGSGIKCSIEDDKLAQNIRVHELSGARYYYDRKGQAHLADTGSKINFTNKGVEYVEGGFYYNYELERQKRELAEIEEKLKLFNDTYPDCPFTIGGTKDNLGFITYAAYDKESGKDYLDKVWTEEWQRENLSLKDYYSGVEITNPEKKDDTIRWV